MKRKFVIPDIRGDLALFKRLLDKVGPTSDDQIIFTGSYIGPGDQSRETVDFLIELMRTNPNLGFLRGCYEYLFGFCIETQPPDEIQKIWSGMGGNMVLRSYEAKGSIVAVDPSSNGHGPMKVELLLHIPEPHIRFFGNLHQWFEDDLYPFVICHSGGHPQLFGGALENEWQTVFAEKDWWKDEARRIPGKTVIFSHYPFEKPFIAKGKLGIDLGAGFGGKLCAFEMFSQKLYVVG